MMFGGRNTQGRQPTREEQVLSRIMMFITLFIILWLIFS
jgi:hypothetical protein